MQSLEPERVRSARALLIIALAFFVPVVALAADTAATPPDGAIPIIDTHSHLSRGGRAGPATYVSKALRTQDENGVQKSIVMPPPFASSHRFKYGWRQLAAVVRDHPARFAFVAGGESLNGLIQHTPADRVTAGDLEEFRREAEQIVAAGAVGFGEVTAEHFSSGRDSHPYESSPPDHPMLLLLAELSAKHGIPIDLHMEAVPEEIQQPAKGLNPATIRQNIPAFERLLAHNREARIVWAHAGWDLTGERTVLLMRTLLGKHPNLYMSIKLDRKGPQRTSAFTPDGHLKPAWIAMLRAFPDRFMVGSDQFLEEGADRLSQARRLIDALPPDIARAVASENAKRIYRLDAAPRQKLSSGP